MTIIVFVIDNGALMNQRTHQGTTLLDLAKTATETFYKVRIGKSRVDRYFILSLNSHPLYVKLAGWKQNCDLQTLHSALDKIKPDGSVAISTGISRAFRLLNLNRMQIGFENYAMGIYPSFFEPAVVITLTSVHSAMQSRLFETFESAIPGHALTQGVHRWDYRLYAVVLGNAGVMDSMLDISRPQPLDLTHSCFSLCSATGGEVFHAMDNRTMHQSLDILASKCQSGVVIDFIDNSTSVDGVRHKQLILMKAAGRIGSTWPIPEQFWPDDDLLSNQLPPRPSNPLVYVSQSDIALPKVPEYFPVDRYELERSPFTEQLLEKKDSDLFWQCHVRSNVPSQDAPFGYLRPSMDLQSVYLHILPFNYPIILDLLRDLYENHNMRMTDAWGVKFTDYLSKIPRYYYGPISKAFERMGFQNVIKAEALERTLPYQLKHNLQKLRHAAKVDYEQFVHMVDNSELLSAVIKLPSSLLPPTLWPFLEMRVVDSHSSKSSALRPFEQPCDIRREKLRELLPRMRQNLNAILDGTDRPMDREGIHQQPMNEMGDYINYKYSRPQSIPLRELVPSPERLDTFGNPFRRKTSTAFVADEVFVDECNLMGGASVGLPAANCGMRRRFSSFSSSQTGRLKGPLPNYITHLNWMHFSSSGGSSPRSEEPSPCSSPLHNLEAPTNYVTVPVNGMVVVDQIGGKRQKIVDDGRASFALNKRLVDQLVSLIRNPISDGKEIYECLTNLTGHMEQKYAAISFVMAESLRFKQTHLYNLLKEWRSCLRYTYNCPESSNPGDINDVTPNEITVNGVC